jgi:hypothetical protein
MSANDKNRLATAAAVLCTLGLLAAMQVSGPNQRSLAGEAKDISSKRMPVEQRLHRTPPDVRMVECQ